MKRILITGAGGSPGIGFTRSLKQSPDFFHTIGFDTNPYNLQRAETDEKYLVPSVKSSEYLPVILDIIHATKPDLIHVQISAEMIEISKIRNQLPCRTFLPDHNTIIICEDKFLSYRCWEDAGIKVPQTMMIGSPEDLKVAFEKFGPKLWLRFTSGSAGRGALPTTDFDEAKLWIDFRKGWGAFSASECLEEQTITWQSIWKDGELIVAQGRKRLYWEFANRAPSGVTGITGTGVTVSDPVVDEIALRAIRAIDKKPHGVFGVDLTYDKNGVPNPTEINIGRFFTTHQFFTQAGLNMPYIFAQAGLDLPLPFIANRVNPLTSGLAWIRGMDVLPVLTTVEQVENSVKALETRRRAISTKGE